MLPCAALAGPAGPAFSFLPFPLPVRPISPSCVDGLAFSHPGLPLSPNSLTTGSHWPNRAGNPFCWCPFSLTRPPKSHTGPHRVEFFLSITSLPLPPLGGGVGYRLSWVCWVCPARSQPGHAGPTRQVWAFAGVVSLPRPLTGHKSPHRAEFGFHRFFLGCFCSDSAAKSFSSL